MRRFSITVSAALVAFTAVAVGNAQAQLLAQANVSVAQARKIVDAIIAECSTSTEVVTVSVAVVDRAGQAVLQVKADTGHPHNWELSVRKAYTARTRRENTSEWKARTEGDSPAAGQRMLPGVVPIGGGVPIMRGDEPVGGVGVTGAPGGVEGDEACAALGVAAIAEELSE